MRAAEWKELYGQLRHLIKNPEVRVSGPFVRVYHRGAECIYNDRRGRLIARVGRDTLYLQNRSIYNEVLKHLLGDKQIGGLEQNMAVRAVGRRILLKEKGQLHDRPVKSTIQTERRRDPFAPTFYEEAVLQRSRGATQAYQISSDQFNRLRYVWGVDTAFGEGVELSDSKFRALARAAYRRRASVRRYLDRFTPQWGSNAGRSPERNLPSRVGHALKRGAARVRHLIGMVVSHG